MPTPDRHIRPFRPWLFALMGRCLAALCLATLVSGMACAQSYKGDTIDTKLSLRGAVAKKYAKDQSGDVQAFKDYVEKFYFPAMTQPDAKSLENLEKLRNELFKQFIAPTTPALQKYLSDEALKYAKRVVTGAGYHPAVRYNALLALGQIDSKYAAEGSGDKPTPSAEANTLLCKVVASGATKDNVPRMMLVGGLVGLERHATLLDKLPAQNQKDTLKAMYGVLAADALAGEYAPGVRDWVYASAARGLASSSVAIPKKAVVAALAKRLADAKVDREVRAEMAALLRDIKPEAADVTPEVIAAVEKLAVEVVKAEARAAAKFEDMQVGGGGMRVAGSGASRSTEMRRIGFDVEGMAEYERAGAATVLGDVLAAVRATKAVAAERQAVFTTVDAAIASAIEALADDESIDLNVTKAIKQTAADVQGAVDPKKGVAEEIDADAF
ncbi:MAG: hypothetical protein ACRCT8_08710 [Lacipirellulaceae bacterium]